MRGRFLLGILHAGVVVVPCGTLGRTAFTAREIVDVGGRLLLADIVVVLETGRELRTCKLLVLTMVHRRLRFGIVPGGEDVVGGEKSVRCGREDDGQGLGVGLG